MKKVNLTSIHPTKVFTNYIYPVLAKEFLITCNDYQDFIKEVEKLFILNKAQYDAIADEWLLKEVMFTEVEEPEITTAQEIAELKAKNKEIGGYYVQSCNSVGELNRKLEAVGEDLKEMLTICTSLDMEESHKVNDIYNIILKHFKKAEK